MQLALDCIHRTARAENLRLYAQLIIQGENLKQLQSYSAVDSKALARSAVKRLNTAVF